MYLKSLTMRGFKSFANKTQLEFEPGTTVIVGPNGSGKSNIVEAFLWVTGEQNPRSLRSTRMDDVIFGGSAVKPASGNAEVSLCFDNSKRVFPIDYSEVTIARRVFRSGESEYMINGAPCRLSDVQDLLLNTGVGKEMYSVVGQGRLDDILNSRPEERRYLIEEAAGLGRFKRRKEKALRKLGSTERNLVRIRDILSEIKRQLKPLQDQARIASQHKRLVNSLRELEVKYILSEMTGLEVKRDEYVKQGEKASKEIKGVETAIAAGRKEMEGFEKRLEECRVRHEQLKDDMQVILTCRERVRGLCDLLKEKRANLERQSERLVDELADYETEIADLDKKIQDHETALKKKETEAQAIFKRIEEREAGADTGVSLAALTQRLSQVRASIQGEERLARILTADLIDSETKGVKLPKSVKGLLGDMIDVPDEYAKAVEAYIGRKLLYMVAKDVKSAKALVKEFQKEGKECPSLIIEGIKTQSRSSKETPKDCRPLIEVVNTKNLDPEVAEHLFGGVYVTESIDRALDLIETIKDDRITLLTDQGHVVSSFSIYAMADKNRELFIGRKRRLAGYMEEEQELAKQVTKMEDESRRDAKDSERLRQELEDIKDDTREITVDLRSARERQEHLKDQIKRLRKTTKDQDIEKTDVKSYEKKIENITGLESLLERLIASITKSMADTNSLVGLERIAEAKYRQDIGDRRSKLAELEKTLAVFERESHLEEISKAQLEPKIKTLTGQLEGDFELSLQEAKKKFKPDKPCEDLIMDMRELRNRIESLGPVNPIAAEEYEEVEMRRQHLEDQINDLKKSERSLHKVIAMMDNTMAEKFKEVFEETNTAFKELFQYMFPEGKAELKLTDPENILTTGIEIEAQPSGKRFKKLSLLSGGESAMTAIALIFAMFKINPAPFYILDECDVALDDVNLQRLVSLVDMFREQAQFLIVTHQRRTMEMADILYGVSMQKDGVSRLVSQRFKEVEGNNARTAKTLA